MTKTFYTNPLTRGGIMYRNTLSTQIVGVLIYLKVDLPKGATL